MKEGDIFEIPIGSNKCVLGQIAAMTKSTLLLIVFSKARSPFIGGDYKPENADIELMAITFDALLRNGTWTIVGNETVNLKSLPKPEFLIGLPEHCEVEDFFGNQLRKATDEDMRRLGYRQIIAPIRLQRATEALHGIRDWNADYDSLRFIR